MNKLLNTIKHEFLEIVPPTIFFFIAFSLLTLTKYLVLQEYGIPFTGFAMAAIGALLVGKVVLITDHLKLVNKFPDKPLLYNVVWKGFIYFIGALVVRYLEHLLPFMVKHHSFIEANRHLFGELVWPHFWLVQMWLAVLLFLYCAIRELARAIGREKVIRLFLGNGDNADA